MRTNRDIKKAVALRYEQNKDDAPKVLAKGNGITAENIIKTGKNNDIPIREDATLTQLLSELNMNEKIPEDLYHAVAEVFAFIYKTEKKFKSKSS